MHFKSDKAAFTDISAILLFHSSASIK